jgi:hypothetical protein
MLKKTPKGSKGGSSSSALLLNSLMICNLSRRPKSSLHLGKGSLQDS